MLLTRGRRSAKLRPFGKEGQARRFVGDVLIEAVTVLRVTLGLAVAGHAALSQVEEVRQ